MLSAIFTLLNLGSFNNLNGFLKQTLLGHTVDLGHEIYGGNQLYPKVSNTVDLGYVTYRGKLDETYPNTVVYFGIPYAEPPVGNLRFRATVPLNTERVTEEVNGEVVDATEPPAFCIQGSLSGNVGGAGSEDCLNVNIYTPLGAKEGDNLPVLFNIHGGGWVEGNPTNWPFDHWIEQSPNVIIVSVYYRFGSFGFLATPEFTDPAYGDFNAGLKDQIQALKWVQSYIRKFGGDPNKVTIAGHSAGAISAELHMITNRTEGLFSRAIAQSVVRLPFPTPEQQQPLFDIYASLAKCNEGSVADKMTCLRDADVSALAQAQDTAPIAAIIQGKPYNLFRPVLDGVLITEHPTTKFQSASDETLTPGNLDISVGLKSFFPLLTDTDIEAFLSLYPPEDFHSECHRFRVATGEPNVLCSGQAMGIPSSRYSDTWTYRYNTPNPRFTLVHHAAEMWMMFNGTNTGPNGTAEFTPQTDAQKAFASELIAYWLSFVRTGNPNTYKLPKSPVWGNYNESDPVRMVLMQDLKNSVDVSGSYMEGQPAPQTARCAFAISMAEVCQN
ncbi:Alpha/Beta hydrolase protein [Suillus paluster]|uniref:Alpha/Beta hydrolase protein n=1 Tax=Suillus paluster TaxID=48578 RepID=UPI001B87D0B2|nr:Alpha/Beta hydrolase protein [Suillus paluster]KAG1730280.1 Alpha/Beta hydrolase protein [Suillus paluster]